MLAAVGGMHWRAERAVALDEADLFHRLVALVRDVDPDIVVGYDVQSGSLGYLIERGAAIGVNVLRDLSRAPAEDPPRRNDGDEYGAEQVHRSPLMALRIARYLALHIATCIASHLAPHLAPYMASYLVPIYCTKRRAVGCMDAVRTVDRHHIGGYLGR